MDLASKWAAKARRRQTDMRARAITRAAEPRAWKLGPDDCWWERSRGFEAGEGGSDR